MNPPPHLLPSGNPAPHAVHWLTTDNNVCTVGACTALPNETAWQALALDLPMQLVKPWSQPQVDTHFWILVRNTLHHCSPAHCSRCRSAKLWQPQPVIMLDTPGPLTSYTTSHKSYSKEMQPMLLPTPPGQPHKALHSRGLWRSWLSAGLSRDCGQSTCKARLHSQPVNSHAHHPWS